MDSSVLTEKKSIHEKRRKRGVLSAGIGASVLGTGFLIQYILYMNDLSFNTIMYTLTIVGIGLIFYAAIQFFN
ncbi:hypothetical protein [Telluribacter humicola]|uniref:hypothetical protein n=1 Tax=Telluribacter humicola TaxID=1720261 RepID=UPI001A9568D7|nr:hypothetical protein [Telluribacter humicola]